MSHTRKLLLCAACANELSKAGDGSLSALQTGFVTPINSNIDVLITGVGIFQTVYHLTRVLSEYEYATVLTAGIAGDYNPDRPLCQLFSVQKTVFADCGFETVNGGFAPVAGSKFLDGNLPPFQSGYIINNMANSIDLPMATANTVNRTCTEPNHVAKLLKRFPADLETMESAAMSYVCAMRHVPHAEIRCTSNHIIPKNQEKWLLEDALCKLGTYVDTILKDFY